MLTADDLDSPAPSEMECVFCGLGTWSCLCDPAHPYRSPTPDEIARARAERLSRLERARGAA